MTPIIFNSLLLLHLTGLVLFAGTTVTDLVTINQFWKQYRLNPGAAKSVLQALSKSPILMRVGIILLILTGVGMMYLTHGVFGEQLWFRIKFGVLVVLLLNYLVVGLRLVRGLQQLTNAEASAAASNKLRTRLNLFQSVQLLLLFTIVLLSVFKFN